MKNGLKWLIKRDNEGNIIKSYTNRAEIENKIINYSRNYYKKAFTSPIYQDKIYEQLNNDLIRNKILNSNLSWDNYDSKEVFEYLQLLKQPKHMNVIEFQPITLNK